MKKTFDHLISFLPFLNLIINKQNNVQFHSTSHRPKLIKRKMEEKILGSVQFLSKP